jgi:hypothetical protein
MLYHSNTLLYFFAIYLAFIGFYLDYMSKAGPKRTGQYVFLFFLFCISIDKFRFVFGVYNSLFFV